MDLSLWQDSEIPKTRNPDKYNKNAERNRMRDINAERRKIQDAAIRQVHRLAAIHDPSGATFNVGPVVLQDDGSVITTEALLKRQERAAAKATAGTTSVGNTPVDQSKDKSAVVQNGGFHSQQKSKKPTKGQQKKEAALRPYNPPPKPQIPKGITVPDGEENWLELWDLPDNEIERRILRTKRRKAAERKALRVKQQSGKTERREARDEKRKIYRDIKLIWKSIKEEQVRERTKLKAAEDEESKKIAVEINTAERKVALELCESLGFTVDNTSATKDIKPRALGMRGKEVDFDAIQIGHRQGDVKPSKRKRVDLGEVADNARENLVPFRHDRKPTDDEDFIKLDIGQGQEHEVLNYNHKLRRKLRRALDGAQVQKEMLVRQRAAEHLKSKGMEPPAELTTNAKPINVKGIRILENGAMETAKQERVKARVELAEFNLASRVLRKQAKQCAVEAGLRKHAALTGRLPLDEKSVNADDYPLPPHIAASAAEIPELAGFADNKRDFEGTVLAAEQAYQFSTESNDESEGSAGTTSTSSVD
ncbi:MAG: hypothetical protein Q9184_003397 [Pyrenodesmia sp. 2 TL-2023]